MVDIPVLQRPEFFDGQRLFADDLTAAQTYHREMRWLHNRGLQQLGIIFGYAVRESGRRALSPSSRAMPSTAKVAN